MKKNIQHLLYLAMILLMIYPAIGYSNTGESPNVIIVLVDDMGHGDIAAHGNPILKTPNFDRLFEASARFTNFAVSPTCSPTRAALLTGRQEFLVGVTHTVDPMNRMDTDAITIAQLFQEKGYTTGAFGKWHLGGAEEYAPWNRGFDETLMVPGDRQKSHFDPVLLKNGEAKQFTGYREDILFSEAMKFIETNKGNPFFCYLPTYSPHSPNIAPGEDVDPYRKYETSYGIDPGFFGQIANVDANIGRLLSFLDVSGLSRNTLLILINDNGGTGGVGVFNSGMRGVKGTAWRGGTRAYSFWKWDDHIFPGDRNQMSGHVDVFPTLADLCQLEVSPGLMDLLDGSSLKPALDDPDAVLDENRMQIHHRGRWDIPGNWPEHKYASGCIRWGTYTLVRIEPCDDLEHCVNCRKIQNRSAKDPNYRLTEPGEWELYDIASDPHQDVNIAAAHPEVVLKMRAFYEDWWTKVEARMTEKWGSAPRMHDTQKADRNMVSNE